MKRTLTTLFLLIISSIYVVAQQRTVPVQVSLLKLYKGDLGGHTSEAVFKFYYDTLDQGHLLSEPCITIITDKKEYTADATTDTAFARVGKLKPFIVATNTDSLHLVMENYEDDKGDICTYDKGDDNHEISRISIYLPTINPGVQSDTFSIKGEKFSALFRVKYGLPAAGIICADTSKEVLPVNQPIALQAVVDLKNKSGLTYAWDYKNQSAEEWKTLHGTFTSKAISLIPSRDVFVKPVTMNEDLLVRVRVISTEDSSAYSETFVVKITPQAPSVDAGDIQVEATCPQLKSGRLSIRNIKAASDTIRYYVVSAKQMNVTLQPDVIDDKVKIASGILSSKDSIVVSTLEAGDYSCIIYNAQQPVGTAFYQYPFTISSYPVLTLGKIEVVPTSCDSVNDGEIRVTVQGGKPGKLFYLIDPPAGRRLIDEANSTATFTALAAGNYLVAVKDECQQDVTHKSIEVGKQVSKLAGMLSIERHPRPSAKDGSLIITMSDSSASYNYNLRVNDVEVIKKQATTGRWSVGQLAAGVINVVVKDPSRPCYLPWDTTLVLQEDTNRFINASFIPDVDQAPAVDKTPVKKGATDVLLAPVATKTLDTDPAYKRPAANASFTPIDEEAGFYSTQKRTSKTYLGFNTFDDPDEKYEIIIEKSKYLLTVLNANKDTVMVYPVVFGNNDLGDKMEEGDRKTPEGIYSIREKKDHAEWDKIMFITFPNEEDQQLFAERKRKGLIPAGARIGDQIAIHGHRRGEEIEIDRKKNWTDGCIATKNEYMEELYSHIQVGTKVTILK